MASPLGEALVCKTVCGMGGDCSKHGQTDGESLSPRIIARPRDSVQPSEDLIVYGDSGSLPGRIVPRGVSAHQPSWPPETFHTTPTPLAAWSGVGGSIPIACAIRYDDAKPLSSVLVTTSCSAAPSTRTFVRSGLDTPSAAKSRSRPRTKWSRAA